MTDLDSLLALGATPCAGDLLMRHKVLGSFRNGEFFITPEGVEALKIVDVEVKPAKSTRKAKPAPVEEAPSGDLSTAELDAILDAVE